MAVCYNCGTPITAEMPIGRSLECDTCRRPVRCCRNCLFYQPGAHWDCRENIPEAVHDKERGNFCDYFRPNNRIEPDRPTGGTNGRPGGDSSARKKFDDLFS